MRRDRLRRHLLRLARAINATFFTHLPERTLRRMAGPPRRSDRGVALDPSVQTLLRLQQALRLPRVEDQATADGRRLLDGVLSLNDGPAQVGVEVAARVISGAAGPLGARVYRSQGLREGAPALVFLHGGGFVAGGLDSHDTFCRSVAWACGCVVVAIDYRLAPEHPFPAAVDDAAAALRWVVSEAKALGADPARVAIGGDSAGANLAAVVSWLTRGEASRPCFQLLLYPLTRIGADTPSRALFTHNVGLDAGLIDWFTTRYLPDEASFDDPRVSILLAPSLEGMPPAHVVTAGFDPLRDEGERLVERLREAGVPVTYTCEEDLVHGFITMTGSVRRAAEAVSAVHERLRDALHKTPGEP